MKPHRLAVAVALLALVGMVHAAEVPKLENPISVEFLQEHLRVEAPRLVFTAEAEETLRALLEEDPVVRNVYNAVKLNASKVMGTAPSERVMQGRRLLGVSREVLYRMNVLGMVYRIEKKPEVLDRINAEVLAVCAFSDWNPSHFLDVAEMSLAVAVALDWTAGTLPHATIELAEAALIEKGLNPSFEGTPGWVNGTNNWNQVCHGGMVAAALTIAHRDMELAAKTISRALDGMPHALQHYGPDGMYPEGATYWEYGTSYSIITASILESALGSDFGLSRVTGFRESALFQKVMETPTGGYYNFGDCGDKRSEYGDFTLAWFAAQTRDALYYEKDRFLMAPRAAGKLSRHAGMGLLWIAQVEAIVPSTIPPVWHADGINPVFVFQGGEEDVRDYYLGGKGGRASINHGTMDAGSFIFELDGVRWALEMGNQSYHELEKTGFNLWGRNQDSERWQLLTKNNFGHNTLSVNGELHVANGFAAITMIEGGPQPKATIDMTPLFGGLLARAERRFIKESPVSVRIEDEIVAGEEARTITWQLLVDARVTLQPGRAILNKDGHRLIVENLSHPDIEFEIVELDPPPHELDRRIRNLKRLELRVPATEFSEASGTIQVRLAGV